MSKNLQVQMFTGSTPDAATDAIVNAVDAIAAAHEQTIQEGFDMCPFADDLASFAAGCKLGIGMTIALFANGELRASYAEENNT